MALGLGLAACQRGLSVGFTTAASLVHELNEARDERRLLNLQKKLARLKLAQDFYWWNPSKLPTPAEWVTVRRLRVKDAINTVWWLSKTPWPKASNRRVLQPYSASMEELLERGYKAKKRPSG